MALRKLRGYKPTKFKAKDSKYSKEHADFAVNFIQCLKHTKGTRVELVSMDDRQAPPPGTKGTVIGVDDTGSLLMRWDNGSGLNVVYGEDVVRKIGEV